MKFGTDWSTPNLSAPKRGVRVVGTIKRSEILARFPPAEPEPTFWQKFKNILLRSIK
jgi:hypothetical protein